MSSQAQVFRGPLTHGRDLNQLREDLSRAAFLLALAGFLPQLVNLLKNDGVTLVQRIDRRVLRLRGRQLVADAPRESRFFDKPVHWFYPQWRIISQLRSHLCSPFKSLINSSFQYPNTRNSAGVTLSSRRPFKTKIRP